jgi:fatty-acyl-CoA synthase
MSAAAFVAPTVRFGADTLPALLRRAAVLGGGFTVLQEGQPDVRLGFEDLARRADGAAAVLREFGVRRGDRVCLLAPTSADLLVALWAVWAAGGVVVVLSSPPRPSDLQGHAVELRRRVEQASARLLLVADDVATLLPESVDGVPVHRLGELSQNAASAPVPVAQDELALLQFTSGTTARSRAVALTHGQVMSNVSALSDALDLSSADRGVSWLPVFHDMGMIIMIVAVAHAAELALLPTEDFARRPGCWMDAVSSFHATITVSPSSGYALATKDLRWRPRDLDLSALRIAGNGAEPIDPTVLHAFATAAAVHGMDPLALCPMYGLAELTLAATVVRPRTPTRELSVCRDDLERRATVHELPANDLRRRRLVSCGRPVPGTLIEIREGSARLPERQVGEIHVSSPSTMLGYWRDPTGTREALSDGWLRTGDLGFLDDGELVVCGRAKDMIIVGGRNLYPEDYEQLAAGIEGVRRGNVVAFGLPEHERMVVVVESRLATPQAQLLAAELLNDMTKKLSHAPEEVVVVRAGTIPKTSSGKVQRDRCRQRYRAEDLPVIAAAARG